MLNFRLSLYRSQKEALEKRIAVARKLGNIPLIDKALAILAIAEGICPKQVANTLKSPPSQSACGCVPFYGLAFQV